MYSRILVGFDGSPAAESALRHAAALATRSGAALCVAHVVDMGLRPIGSALGLDLGASGDARREAGRATIARAAAIAVEAGLQAESRLLETASPTEGVADILAEAAEECRADLVVLGTHGRTGLQKLIMGSTADGVARRALVPVLLVPSPDEGG